MYLTELQRRLILRKNRLQRVAALAVAVLTFGAALCMSIQTALTVQPEIIVEQNTARRHTEEPAGETGQRLELTAKETELMARAVYSEARGEQFQGQIAVAAVIFNRIEDPDFPNDVAGVIFQPLAFTAVADGQFWFEPDEQAYSAVEKALRGDDPSGGALYYYNPATATSRWIFSRPQIKRIGNHLFCG